MSVKTERRILLPLTNLAIDMGLTPNAISVIGFLLAGFVGILYGTGHFLLAGIFLAITGIMDLVDGEVARNTGILRKSGALTDSALDRFAEALIFLGLLYYFYDFIWVSVLLYLALVLSFMVSYLRARGEGLGITVKGGIMNRSGRLVFLTIVSLLGAHFFILALPLFIGLVFSTVVIRWRRLYNTLDL